VRTFGWDDDGCGSPVVWRALAAVKLDSAVQGGCKAEGLTVN